MLFVSILLKDEEDESKRCSGKFTSREHYYYYYYVCMYVCMVTRIKGRVSSVDQPGKLAIPARGQLNRGNFISLSSVFAPENLVSRHGFGSPVPRQPTHLHTQAGSVQ